MQSSTSLKSLRTWLSDNQKHANWIVFGLFTLMVFGKTLLFDHFAFRELALHPSITLYIYQWITKIAAALFFASFTFLLRDKRWLILLSFIIDTWFIANLIYMRNNHILLDAEAFNMSSNLHGYFWSVLIYIEWGIDLLFYSEKIASYEIVDLLKQTGTTEFMEFARGLLQMVAFRLEDGAPLIDKCVSDISSFSGNSQYKAVAIARDEDTIIPGPDTKFQENDLVFELQKVLLDTNNTFHK